MYFVGCDDCKRKLVERGFTTYAEAERKRAELGHRIVTKGTDQIVCAECAPRHEQVPEGSS